MSDKESLSTSYYGKTLRALRYITVEPAVIGSLFMLFLYTTLGKQYVFLRLAEDYNLTQTNRESSCNESNDDADDPNYDLFLKVSAETSAWIFYLSIATFIPAIFSTVTLASWSDKFGRKPPILISLFGFIVLIMVYVIVINLNAPVAYLLIGHILCGLCGDSATLFACSFSHVADITKPSERTFRITVIETCIGIGGFVSAISGGIWLDRKGFKSPFWFLLALTIVDFLYIALRLESSNDKWFKNLKYLFSKEPFVHMYQVLKPQANNKNRHISIILYLTAYFLLITSVTGIALIIVTYEIGLPFCWNSIQVGIGQAIVQAGYFIILVLVKIFTGVTAELRLIAAGIVSNSVSCVLLAFAVDDWMIYLGLVVQMLYLMPSPLMRSQMSRLVSVDETGPIFALQCCVANISSIVASALFNVVLGATVGSTVPGAAFLLSPIILLVFFVPVFRVAYKQSKDSLLENLSSNTTHTEDKL